MRVPLIALAIGGLVKLVLNILLISNPNINIYGATISSIACQGIAFTICFVSLTKSIKLRINLKNNILKPVFCAGFMGLCTYGTYTLLHTIFVSNNVFHGYLLNMVPTAIAIIIGAIIYGLTIIFCKCLSKDEIYMIPYGTKLYAFLLKRGIYKEVQEGEQ